MDNQPVIMKQDSKARGSDQEIPIVGTRKPAKWMSATKLGGYEEGRLPSIYIVKIAANCSKSSRQYRKPAKRVNPHLTGKWGKR